MLLRLTLLMLRSSSQGFLTWYANLRMIFTQDSLPIVKLVPLPLAIEATAPYAVPAPFEPIQPASPPCLKSDTALVRPRNPPKPRHAAPIAIACLHFPVQAESSASANHESNAGKRSRRASSVRLCHGSRRKQP